MDTVKPRDIGKVDSLIGAPLGASVQLPDGEQLKAFRIEVAPGHKGPQSPVWAKPLWTFDSGLPSIRSLDGREAFENLLVDDPRPEVVVVTTAAIDRFSWILRQDGQVVDRGGDVDDGIAPDGLSFEFEPTKRLRRSGEDGQAPQDDAFYPPIDSHLPGMERTPEARISYTVLTHDNHIDHDAFAIDFNWGTGADDRNHWVRAAAAGRVIKVDAANGQVHILHKGITPNVEFETVYAHMEPVLVADKEKVVAQQRIGRIGSQYHDPSKTISPHLHFQMRRDGNPIQARLLIRGKVVPVAVSVERPDRTIVWNQRVPGWIQPRGPASARLIVKARDAASQTWSGRSAIGFRIARAEDGVPPDQEALFAKLAKGPDINVVYRGGHVEPGEYSARYKVFGDAGTESAWAYDKSIIVEPALA